jgi:hypothetical protein
MKTPREILLERHRAADAKLDAIRRAVMARELNNQATKEQSSGLVALLRCCSNAFWRELISPNRRIWSGLAAVWILIFIVNFSERDPRSSVGENPVHAPAVMMSWQTQRMMAELLADRATAPDADRPKSNPSKPRTEISGTLFA